MLYPPSQYYPQYHPKPSLLYTTYTYFPFQPYPVYPMNVPTHVVQIPAQVPQSFGQDDEIPAQVPQYLGEEPYLFARDGRRSTYGKQYTFFKHHDSLGI